jgi:hypothetical protein
MKIKVNLPNHANFEIEFSDDIKELLSQWIAVCWEESQKRTHFTFEVPDNLLNLACDALALPRIAEAGERGAEVGTGLRRTADLAKYFCEPLVSKEEISKVEKQEEKPKPETPTPEVETQTSKTAVQVQQQLLTKTHIQPETILHNDKASEAPPTEPKPEAPPTPRRRKSTIDDKAFAKLSLDEMIAILSYGKNVTPIRAGAFARAAQTEFPGRPSAIAAEMDPVNGFQGIKKDEVKLALFVQRIIDGVEQWRQEKADDDIPF